MEWQPIETLPQDGTNVILYLYLDDGIHLSEPIFMVDRFCTEINDWTVIEAGKRGKEKVIITHWMPLPPPPVNAKQSQSCPVNRSK